MFEMVFIQTWLWMFRCLQFLFKREIGLGKVSLKMSQKLSEKDVRGLVSFSLGGGGWVF